MASASTTTIAGDKILKYETFINETLKEDLKNVFRERENVNNEISEYTQLQETIAKLQNESSEEPIKTKVDIGQNLYVNAIVPEREFIYVKSILGLFIPLTFPEALVYAEKKVELLKKREEIFVRKASSIKATIKVVTQSLQELQGIKFDGKPPPRFIDL